MSQPINTLTSYSINGVEQWVSAQSSDETLPVLLVLHGGPGYAIMPLFHGFNRSRKTISSSSTGTSGAPADHQLTTIPRIDDDS